MSPDLGERAETTANRPSLRDRKKDATRQAIEDAAWELFEQQGYEATTVQQIAEQANVAPRTFFRYYPTKEAVLYPELDGLLDDMEEAFLARPADEPAFVGLTQAMVTVSDEMSEGRSRQFERFQMLKRAGTEGPSSFLTERVTARMADMVRRREAGSPDAELRAQLAARVVGIILATASDQWLQKGAVGDMNDESLHCFDVLRSLITNS